MRNFTQKTLPVCLFSLLAGLCNGLLGAGGGILLVYGLKKHCRRELPDPRTAFTTALAVMVPLSAFSAWRYARAGHLQASALHPLILPAVVGGMLGALLLRVFSPRALSRLFSAVVLVSGIVLVL